MNSETNIDKPVDDLERRPDLLAERVGDELLTEEERAFFRQYAQGPYFKTALAAALFTSGGPQSNIDITYRDDVHDRQDISSEMAEVSGQEYRTASFVSRQFEKLLRQGQEDGTLSEEPLVEVLVKDGDETVWLPPDKFRERLGGNCDNLRVVAVTARLQGDDSQGESFIMRNDMDALPFPPSGETEFIRHDCGHNMHIGWAIANMQMLIEYKRRFGRLPFRDVVFISEANEEGFDPSFNSPEELTNADFLKRYGPHDMVLGSHVAANTPEGELILQEELFFGSGDLSVVLQPTENYDPATDPTLESIAALVAEEINRRYHSDDPIEGFGMQQLTEDFASIPIPAEYVRITKILKPEEPGMTNMLDTDAEGQVLMGESVYTDFRPRIEALVEEQLAGWHRLGFELKADIDYKDGVMTVGVHQPHGGHSAFGGVNVHQVVGSIVTALLQEDGITLSLPTGSPDGVQIKGTVRIKKEISFQRSLEQVESTTREIAEQLLDRFGLTGKVAIQQLGISYITPPVNIETKNVETARELATELGVQETTTSTTHAAAETIGFYKQYMNIPEVMYFAIGALDREKADEYLRSGKPLDAEHLHHSGSMRLKDITAAYGAFAPALLLSFAKKWNRERAS